MKTMAASKLYESPRRGLTLHVIQSYVANMQTHTRCTSAMNDEGREVTFLHSPRPYLVWRRRAFFGKVKREQLRGKERLKESISAVSTSSNDYRRSPCCFAEHA